MHVRYTLQADDDLLKCYVDGALEFGMAQAERYEQDLRRVIGLLADNPKIARERPEFGLPPPPVRIHHHGSHYIAYRLYDDHILIGRILPDRMELERHISRQNPL